MTQTAETIETFTCANCKGEFNKGRSDEEALAELEEDFPDDQDQPMEVICEDCYQQMTAFYGWNQA